MCQRPKFQSNSVCLSTGELLHFVINVGFESREKRVCCALNAGIPQMQYIMTSNGNMIPSASPDVLLRGGYLCKQCTAHTRRVNQVVGTQSFEGCMSCMHLLNDRHHFITLAHDQLLASLMIKITDLARIVGSRFFIQESIVTFNNC
jgi:hypothetical protein